MDTGSALKRTLRFAFGSGTGVEHRTWLTCGGSEPPKRMVTHNRIRYDAASTPPSVSALHTFLRTWSQLLEAMGVCINPIDGILGRQLVGLGLIDGMAPPAAPVALADRRRVWVAVAKPLGYLASDAVFGNAASACSTLDPAPSGL